MKAHDPARWRDAILQLGQLRPHVHGVDVDH